MKKIILMLTVCAMYVACSNATSERDKEKADSIAAASAADSMLQAASADTLSTDSLKTDSLSKDSVK